MKTYLLLLLFVLTSCGQNCKDLPSSNKNYEEAKTIILDTNFKFADNCDVSESSFITTADYYSCDGLTGFFIVGMNGKKYVFENMPFEIWEDFKNAESKGKFYNLKIKGRYKLSLK